MRGVRRARRAKAAPHGRLFFGGGQRARQRRLGLRDRILGPARWHRRHRSRAQPQSAVRFHVAEGDRFYDAAGRTRIGLGDLRRQVLVGPRPGCLCRCRNGRTVPGAHLGSLDQAHAQQVGEGRFADPDVAKARNDIRDLALAVHQHQGRAHMALHDAGRLAAGRFAGSRAQEHQCVIHSSFSSIRRSCARLDAPRRTGYHSPLSNSPIAQLVERRTVNPQVPGSSPGRGAKSPARNSRLYVIPSLLRSVNANAILCLDAILAAGVSPIAGIGHAPGSDTLLGVNQLTNDGRIPARRAE